ncbi:hypothetical protein C2G38_2214833 [Gigaspora rosea]|uniref:Uncharacterized protein n=1 Tax=Gigaspora rosea TaxID=44941 RepID=A0A397UAM1_9GLOM|nr:hypothetical protein C2G38_2214833 [Gigaspora rosea]
MAISVFHKLIHERENFKGAVIENLLFHMKQPLQNKANKFRITNNEEEGPGDGSSSSSYGGSSSNSSSRSSSSTDIILCGFWRCYIIRKFYKDDRLLMIMKDPPPTYDTAYGEKSHLHGLRHNASYEAYKAGRQFTRDNPPHEILPQKENIAYILSNGGAKAWKMVVMRKVVLAVLQCLKILQVYRPQLDGDDYLQSNPNIATSATSNNILLGWNKHSVGYHSNDECKFNGEKWDEVGDTIGK